MALSFIDVQSVSGTTATMPTHQQGDLLIAVAVRFTSGSFTTIPSGWFVAGYRNSTNAMGAVVIFKVAASAAESLSAITGAEIVSVISYRESALIPFVGSANLSGSSASSTIAYNSILTLPATGAGMSPLRDQTGSWVVMIGWTKGDKGVEVPSTSGTLRNHHTSGSNEIAIFDTNAEVSTFAAETVALTGSVGWGSFTIEVMNTGLSAGGGVIGGGNLSGGFQ